jgi:hypothetical protein
MTTQEQRDIEKQLEELPSSGEVVVMLTSDYKLRNPFTNMLFEPGVPTKVDLPLDGWIISQIEAGLMIIRPGGKLRR